MTCQGQYRVLPGKTDPGDFKDCFPKTPARICLEAAGEAHCYSPPNDKFDPPSNEAYIFGLEPKAKAVGRLDGKELTLFTAMFSGCGSGTLTYFSLLAVRDSEFVNLLPKVELTNHESDAELWSLPHYSSLPVLVTADFIWDYKAMEKSNYSEETHFAHQRYKIRAYVFDVKSDRYIQKVHYETTKKYPGLDDADEIQVLDTERQTILTKLRRDRTNPAPTPLRIQWTLSRSWRLALFAALVTNPNPVSSLLRILHGGLPARIAELMAFVSQNGLIHYLKSQYTIRPSRGVYQWELV